MKFIHASDIHLDSQPGGLERYVGPDRERVLNPTRSALENLVDLAISEEVGFVLISGDLYDSDWKDYNTGIFMSGQLSRLREAGILAFIIAGNHDAASNITKDLRLPDNTVMLDIKHPQTVVLEDLGVAVHGQGFATRAVTTDLSAGYPERLADYFNVGMLHTALNGREGHEPYAPCSLDGLVSKGYDYWALGHVHQREVVRESPWVVFSGSTQGRNAREQGARGCMVVTVEDGRVDQVEHRPLDVMRWSTGIVDAAGCMSGDEVLDRAEEELERVLQREGEMPLAVRLVVRGACRAHAQLQGLPEKWVSELQAMTVDKSGGRAWLEKAKFKTEREQAFRVEADLPGVFVEQIAGFTPDDDFLEHAVSDLQDLSRKLPVEFREQEDSIDLTDLEAIRSLLEDAKDLILEALLPEGDES